MPSSIIRARTVVTEPADRRNWRQIEDGAALQHDGVIAEIGPAEELIAKHPGVPVLGSTHKVMLPGFVNAHHHIGLTPMQLGSPDMPLELWFVTRLVMRRIDLYLDTLYSAFEMIASGITTVQHLHGWVPGGPEAVEAGAGEVIRAYEDIGMRVSYSFALRDQNRLVYRDDQEFTASLPAELRPALERHFARFGLSLADYGPLFEHLRATHLPQLQLESPIAQRDRTAQHVRETRHQHRDRSRRGRDQRRPRHVAGNAHGVTHAPGSGDGRRGHPEPGSGIAHGDHQAVPRPPPSAAISAPSRSARPPISC